MIIKLTDEINRKEKASIISKVSDLNFKTREVKTQKSEYLIGIGTAEFDIREIGHLPGVEDIHVVSDNFKLVSRKWKVKTTTIHLGHDISIGRENFSVMAGPCAIEGEKQILETLSHLRNNGVKIMRGGVFKPRSSPYSFRGLGMDGLKLWYEAAKEYGIKIITEVMQVSQVEEMYDFVDIYQVGARNTQNFNLLDELGKVDKPVMIKRGISGTIDELLYSAEYVFSGGNENLILCERGIRTYETASRNTLDLNAIPILKDKTHLPVIADPSHGIGIRKYIEPLALASIMAGADGVIYELHKTPEEAASDGYQSLNFFESEELIRKMRKVYEMKRQLNQNH
ncbi:MAG TPA: 3-deoxy-7-phosphoheptulonate synthase [Cyclobacteriaceae bacterium]|jgi:3-deoxy-7-phosphoheptulonate synthase